MKTEISIRTADWSDRDALRDLQALSLRTLAAPYYDSEAIEAFIAMGTMYEGLLDEGTFFAVAHGTTLIGCGGWSSRIPNYARFAKGAVPEQEEANVRRIFVHPHWERRGVARRIMEKVETDIVRAGIDQTRLLATLSGVPLYRRLGWRSGDAVTLRLPGGFKLASVDMYKRLAPAPDARLDAAAA
ncbi:MAG: GNAT family N-acetyltransferase [Xanthobacteraceae bacterium]